MYSERTLLDNAEDLVQSHLTTVVDLQSAPRDETTIVDREYNGVEEPSVLAVERAIDEDVAWLMCHSRLLVL